MEEQSAGEILTTVFLCLAVVGGAAYGWLGVGTVWATLGGAILIGVAALFVVTVLTLAVDGIARLFSRSSDR